MPTTCSLNTFREPTWRPDKADVASSLNIVIYFDIISCLHKTLCSDGSIHCKKFNAITLEGTIIDFYCSLKPNKFDIKSVTSLT